jgi:heterodisulfide reductase subunit B
MNRHFGTSYHMPIIFFTQLMGLAFGMDAKQLGFGMELVSAKKALTKIGVEAPEPVEVAPAKPRRAEGLPMPQQLPRRKSKVTEKGKVAK